MKGKRPYMDDRTVIGFVNNLAAFFDGHSGDIVADYLHKQFIPTLTPLLGNDGQQTHSNDDIIKHLTQTLHHIDRHVLGMKKADTVGATVSLSYFNTDATSGNHTIITANCGDSRTILSQGRKAIE